MTTARRFSAAAAASTLALLVLAQCRRADVPPPVIAAAAPAPAAVPVAAEARPVSTAATDSALAPTASPSGDGWLDGNIYRVRMANARPCPPSGAGATRVGVRVYVASKIGDLLVAPRDFKLETGGVVLDSAIIHKAPPACAPLLAPKSLGAGKTTEGVVVFDLPPGFNTERRPVRITYQPTRWGGARRVEAVLPAGSFAL